MNFLKSPGDVGWDWIGELQVHPQTPLGQFLTLSQIVRDNHPKSVDAAGLKALLHRTQYHLFLCAGEETEAWRDADPHLETNQPGAFLPLSIKSLVHVSMQ